MSINDSMYYYAKNLQGDIIKIVNHQGKVMVEHTYDAWGNILKETADANQSYATAREFNPFQYIGYVYDTQIQVCITSKLDTMTQKPVNLSMLMILRILVLPVLY